MPRGRGTADYHFVDCWRVSGTEEEVADILKDVTEYSRWWPSTYISVTETEPGDADGIGRAGAVYARGWLPYTIRFDYRVTASDYPRRYALVAQGDLTGTGVWDIEQDGEWVDVTYTWTVRSEKPLLRYLSFLMKPLFRSNHTWTMRRGERSMEIELLRRRATGPEDFARLPSPPGPVSPLVWAGALAAVLVSGWVAGRLSRRRSVS